MKDPNIVNESSQAPEPTIKAMFKDIWTGLGHALAPALAAARTLVSGRPKESFA